MSHLIGLHRKQGDEREEHDFYATHPRAIPPLMELLGWQNGGKLIRENSCGQGHLSQMLEIYGHTVVSTDLIDRGYGISGVDFLVPGPLDSLPYDGVIMNPPFKHARRFISRSLEIAPVVCAFLRITFLESARRRSFFESNPPRYVAVFCDRIESSKNAKFIKDDGKPEKSATLHSWFIWHRGYRGRPEIVWI